MPDEEKEKDEEELYVCNGCLEQTPIHRARITCRNCTDYHLCANCFVIKQYVKPHTESHATWVLKQSGVIVPGPPGLPPKAPALPPRPKPTLNTRQPVELPTANWGALWNVLKAPLEKKDKRGKADSIVTDGLGEMRDVSPSSMISGANGTPEKQLPPTPARSVGQGLDRANGIAPSYSQPESWVPLFEPDFTPTPIFVALMSTIFGHLDPLHTRSLTPEVYSDFLDVQGYELGSNIWRYGLETDGGEQSKDVADLELGLYYADLNISHTLKIRPHESSAKGSMDESQLTIEERTQESLRLSANMPMLSRQGFIDLCAIEYLRDPSKGYGYLKRVVEKYSVWTELGEIPRSMLPESSVQKNLLTKEMESEPENVISKVLLAEKLVMEEEKKIESDNQNGYASEELRASTLPMRVKGSEAKAEVLMGNDELENGKEDGKIDAALEPSEAEA